ncbi:MAG: ABC transporter substrate-binding protein [Xanthobacteraceae bacterium]|jgi:peptide/nickel transport system substrate-binding protein
MRSRVKIRRRDFLKGTTAGLASLAAPQLARAQSNGTILLISESGANSVDPHTPGANRGSYEIAWNCYDRLLSLQIEKDANGTDHANAKKPAPELAEEWDDSGHAVTLKLRQDATFHNGAPVTAKDVKWSLDRAIAAGGNPRFQMSTASLSSPEQFVVVDDHTFRIDYDRFDRQMLPNLAFCVPNILNSELIKKNATAADPWGLEWSKNNLAGGGAYQIVDRTPDSITYTRFDNWKSGPLPKTERVIWRIVPSSATRRALLERGDVDVSNEFPPKDIVEMEKEGKLKVLSTPIDNAVQFVVMNEKMPPFDNVKVRRAIAYAIPYQKIMDVALFNKARPLFGGPAQITDATWPQPSPFDTDLAKAKALLAEAGFANGFETTFSFDASAAGILEPMSVLIQESMGQIGVKVTLDKIAGANWRSSFTSKSLPFHTNLFSGWIDYPSYFFEMALGKTSIFNSGDFDNDPAMAMLHEARFERDPVKYDEMVEKFMTIVFDDVANVPVYQPSAYVAMQKNISGYRYWFHRQMDYRTLVKT